MKSSGAIRYLFLRSLLTLLVFGAVSGESRAQAVSAKDNAYFEQHVRPLLAKRCQNCHGPKKQWAELRLDTAAGLRKGGESGPVVVAGKPDESELFHRITEQDVDLRMPPEESGPKLTAQQIKVLSHWIKIGAPWPASANQPTAKSLRAAQRRHWAFQPVARPVPPDSVRRLFGKLKAKGHPVLLIDRPDGGHDTDFADTMAAACFVVDNVRSIAEAGESIPLRAGPVTMVFDADNVFLRYIRVGSHEVLRGINAPIRNQNWSTIAPEVSNLRVENRGDSFKVTFDVACQQADIDFRWKGSISGSAKGVIEFTFDGEAHSTFKRNRIGFCVLHGASAAGQPWLLETADGKKSKGRFPKFISPHQLAKNLRAITHEVTPGLHARVDFEGEVFEMEDQRNWTDASFKTYCTPLKIPYTVEVPKGTKISQKIRISVAGDLPGQVASSSDRTVLTIGKGKLALPLLGVQVSREVEDLTDEQLKRLRALNLDHLRVNLALSNESFVKDLRRATSQAKALGVSLHIGLSLGKSPGFAALLKEISELQPPVSFWLVTGSDPAHFQMAHKHLASVAGEAKIGVTRVTNFVDLNRARPEDKSIQAVGFAINPQIHAFDNASIVETLPIHADAVNSTRQFAGDRPLVIGPITMAPQLLDGVDQPGGPPQGGPLPTYVDKRQVEPFTAVWTLGSLNYLADAGAHSATFFETVGWNGIMDADDVSSRPKAFPSRPGELFPVYHLLREIGEFKGGHVRQIDSSNNLAAIGIALHKTGRIRVLVGNLTGKAQAVSLRGLSGKPVAIQLLGAAETQATPELTIKLPPYGIARIDRETDQRYIRSRAPFPAERGQQDGK